MLLNNLSMPNLSLSMDNLNLCNRLLNHSMVIQHMHSHTLSMHLHQARQFMYLECQPLLWLAIHKW
jgi:hypothetical protein